MSAHHHHHHHSHAGNIGHGHAPTSFGRAFAIGVLLQGGYNGVWPLAAAAYPSEIRATGVGWAIGIGRSGAIIGPMLGGVLMDAKVAFPVLFAAYCLPLLLCAVGAFSVAKLSHLKKCD